MVVDTKNLQITENYWDSSAAILLGGKEEHKFKQRFEASKGPLQPRIVDKDGSIMRGGATACMNQLKNKETMLANVAGLGSSSSSSSAGMTFAQVGDANLMKRRQELAKAALAKRSPKKRKTISSVKAE